MQIRAEDIAKTPHLPAALNNAAGMFASSPAQLERVAGEYRPIAYAELERRVRRVASGLLAAGICPGDRVAILMENRPEWAVADFAILSAGAVSVPLYCSYRPRDIAYVMKDAGVKAAFVSAGKLLDHIVEAAAECPELKAVYALEPGSGSPLVQPLSALEAATTDDEALEARLDVLNRDALATLVYTSGTTGDPKGVMLSHGNLLANVESVLQMLSLGNPDRMLSFLPLAHCLERLAGHFLVYSVGASVAFAERPDTVAKNLAEAMPTILVSVPRLFEVMQSRILAQVAKQPASRQRLFHDYLRLAMARRQGGIGLFARLKWMLLDRLVGAKLRSRFGGRLRVMVSGGAPLSVEIAEFFEAVGVPILEGYGLTESSPVLAFNPEEDRRPGFVGKVPPGVEVSIAADGEILARGDNIMQGYWQQPEATAETIIDGWLHTGDIGDLDSDGYLRITDRKKDVIVNSGGENVAPQRIESMLVADALIEQVVVFGDKRPHLVALVVPSQEAAMEWAKKQGIAGGWDGLVASAALQKELLQRIHTILKPLAQHEQVRRISLHPDPFTIEEGLLTPTLKIRRRQVYERFAPEIEALY